uniref:Uncharacterized protein n=1 Tax=Ananas comosus var. bracteatus TaxID=296719 RepID=A0A6V7P9L6_ANACO|nr:unnamed protein product [Ananas comosus var. bracteatus]
MSDGSQSIPHGIEIGKVRACKKNIEWLEKKLTEADNLFEKGEALLDKTYGNAPNHHTIFKCERKADGREPPEPRAVSIGPYHHNCKNPLKFHDDYKLEITRFMAKYCSLDTKKYLNAMEENEEAPDYHYVEYMALHLDVREHLEPIKLDLLTVDNQIPLFTIKILLGCFPEDSSIRKESIKELALWCFDDLWPMKNEEQDLVKRRSEEQDSEKERKEEQVRSAGVPLFLEEQEIPLFLEVDETDQFHHLLDLFHWSRIPKKGYEMEFEDAGSRNALQLYIPNALQLYIPSATELQKSATKFKKKDSGSCLDITLHSTADYRSKPIFHNLIAFEATPRNRVLCFTAYTACMSSLLQREDDVKVLRERGIIASTNYKDADIVKFFEELNKEVEGVEMPDTLRKLYTNVNDHHNSRTSQWYGNFPWIKVALAGSYLLFLLTLMQTVYSILSYHHPKNK